MTTTRNIPYFNEQCIAGVVVTQHYDASLVEIEYTVEYIIKHRTVVEQEQDVTYFKLKYLNYIESDDDDEDYWMEATTLFVQCPEVVQTYATYNLPLQFLRNLRRRSFSIYNPEDADLSDCSDMSE